MYFISCIIVIGHLRHPNHSVVSEVYSVASEIKRPVYLIFGLLNDPLICSLTLTTVYSQMSSSPGGEKNVLQQNIDHSMRYREGDYDILY